MKSLSLLFALHAQLFAASPGTRDLRCEYHASPLAIGINQPRFSWKMTAEDPAARGLLQTAYEIQVARSEQDFERNLLWTSGKVASAASDQIVYAGKPLSNAKVEPHSGAPVRPTEEMAARRSKFTLRFI
jgi:alpha-L-rhamnosidase